MFNPDICLCSGDNCPLRDNCLRYQYHLRASQEKDSYNSYFVDPPYEDGKCDYQLAV